MLKIIIFAIKVISIFLFLLFYNQAISQVLISEFVASNETTLADQFGDQPDWIEIHNNTPGVINLAGWALTDSKSKPFKWRFPQITISGGDYLIVFASGRDITQSDTYLHTNFKLSATGEYLALIDNTGKVISGFVNGYPKQYEDVSFAYIEGEYKFTSNPTPNKTNVYELFLPPPVFSVERGLFDNPFKLSIKSSTGSAVKYTTDGSDPGHQNGTLLTSSFNINATSIIRAVSVQDNKISKSVTHTYIFRDDVFNQPEKPVGYPDTWGSGVKADYEMDPEICNVIENRESILYALSSLPIVSVVSDPANFFSAEKNSETGGIYVFTNETWERSASVEIFGGSQKDEIQANCGVRLQGGQSRVPNNSPKHSFRLVFKSEYGSKKLDYKVFDDSDAAIKFNTIHLKAGYNNSWIHWDSEQRKSTQYIRDVWAKHTYRQMGHLGVRTKYVNLFINGMYWGLYNISERIDKEFMESYIGGDAEDYDVIKDYGEVVDGFINGWNALTARARDGLSDNAAYYRIQGKNIGGSENLAYPAFIDPINLADYMILNFYGGNDDWDHHNWAAARSRKGDRNGFRFFVWDAERILEDVNRNITNRNNRGCPSEVFQTMIKNIEFKQLFADRVHKHMLNNGCLTPEVIAETWENFADEIKPAIVAESARWGDYRKDVNPRNQPYPLYTVNFWEAEKNRLQTDFFPYRTNIVIEQFKMAGWLPAIDAPVFNKNGGLVNAGFSLEMGAIEGEIYYSLYGDPRLSGGEISPEARIYSSPISISNYLVNVKARVKQGENWSALTEAVFVTEYPTSVTRLELSNNRLYNFPNPVRDNTMISCTLPLQGNVRLLIITVQGRVVQTINLGFQPAGDFNYAFDAAQLSGGVYLYKIQSGNIELKSKMVILR